MEYEVHKNKDNRMRAYYKDELTNKHKIISYPRIVVEEHLKRKLNDDEIVHHIDENPENNNIDNLMVLTRKEHGKLHMQKYFDKEVICEVCHKKFIWTSERQGRYYRDLRRGRNRIITCSKKCSSYYGRLVQLKLI